MNYLKIRVIESKHYLKTDNFRFMLNQNVYLTLKNVVHRKKT